QRSVSPDRGRLERLVPVTKLLSPILPLEDLFRPPEAFRELILRNRPHDAVPEAVDVPHLERLDQHAVRAGELARTTPEGRRMELHPVPRRRPREVNGVELPGAWARGLEAKLRYPL